MHVPYVDIIYIIDSGEQLPDFLKGVQTRFDRYAARGIAEQFRLRVLQTDVHAVIEVMLVDEEDAFLLFSVIHGTGDIQKGVLFENQPAVSKELVAWFEHRVKQGAQDLREWSKRVDNEPGG